MWVTSRSWEKKNKEMDSSLEQACDTWILASKTVGLLTYRNIRQ